MTFRLIPAVRWCALLFALILLVTPLTPRGGSAAWAEGSAARIPPPPADDRGASDPEPIPGIIGLPPELQTLSRDELIGLVKDLTLQNQILAQLLAEQRQALADAAPDLQARIDYQARTIERLKTKLARAEAAAEQAAAAPVEVEVTEPQAEADASAPAAPVDDATAAAADPPWEYRFAYEFGLIRTSGNGRVILRDENGKRQSHEYDFSEFRRDAIWASLLFRNDSAQPMRFTGLIELQGDKPFGKGPRERLASHAFRTPLLEPGEVFQLSESELRVERPWKVDILELTEVQAFPTPADPDPDPANR